MLTGYYTIVLNASCLFIGVDLSKILGGKQWHHQEMRGEGAQQVFPLLPCPGFLLRSMTILACFWGDIQKCNTCFSLAIFKVFTAKLAAAAEYTEFPKLEGGMCPNAP